jgi:hypothetical protein
MPAGWRADIHRDATAGRREFDGVGQQTPDNLLDPGRIRRNGAGPRIQRGLELNALAGHRRAEGFDGVTDEIGNIDLADIEPQLPRHHARHIEQVLDQSGLRLRISLDRQQSALLAIVTDHSIHEHACPSGDGRQRRAQLVRHGHQKLIFESVCRLGVAPRCLLPLERFGEPAMGGAHMLGLRASRVDQRTVGSGLRIHLAKQHEKGHRQDRRYQT